MLRPQVLYVVNLTSQRSNLNLTEHLRLHPLPPPHTAHGAAAPPGDAVNLTFVTLNSAPGWRRSTRQEGTEGEQNQILYCSFVWDNTGICTTRFMLYCDSKLKACLKRSSITLGSLTT